LFKKHSTENVLKFYTLDEKSENLTNPPVPASSEIPSEWKDTHRFIIKDATVKVDKDKVNLGLKHCMPYYDAMTSGYIQPTHGDILVEIFNGKPVLTFRSELPVVHKLPNEQIKAPQGHYEEHWSFNMWWGLKTPKGYSCLITQPLNRNLPFTISSGIMDTDNHTAPGNISFHIKKGFEGVIPAGTPMFHIFPFKREAWRGEVDHSLRLEGHYMSRRKLNYLYGYYKKNAWVRKEYR